jgi:hypothetical protein
MNLQEIKEQVELGNIVYCQSLYYQVIKDKIGQWLIKGNNGYYIGLTGKDNKTLNADEKDFFTIDNQ